jgi:ELWxxDGT repeat protein
MELWMSRGLWLSVLMGCVVGCGGAQGRSNGALVAAKQVEREELLAAGDAARLVKDIWTGKRAVVVESRLYEAGDIAYFIGGRGGSGCAIWRTDGTDSGTREVWRYPDQAHCWDVDWLQTLGDRAVFRALDGAVRVVDREGAVEVLAHPCEGEACGAIEPGVFYTNDVTRSPAPLNSRCDEALCMAGRSAVRSGGRVFWARPSGEGESSALELWGSDGSAAGTARVAAGLKDVWLVQDGADALMWRCEEGAACGLWRLSAKPTLAVKAPLKGAITARGDLRVKGQRCLMLMIPDSEASAHSEFWCAKGGRLVEGGAAAAQAYATASRDGAALPAYEAMSGWWARQRVKLGARLVTEAEPDEGPRVNMLLWQTPHEPLFVDPPRGQHALWVLPTGEEDEADEAYGWRGLGAGAGGGYHGAPQFLTPLDGGRVVFFARDELSGVEPWVMDAQGTGAMQLADLKQGPDSSYPIDVTAHGDVVCFTLTTQARWCTDGTRQGTRKMPSPRAWPLASGVVSMEVMPDGWRLVDARGAELIAARFDDELGEEEHAQAPEDVRALPMMRVWRGRLYVFVPRGERSAQLMVTDGSAAGTRELGSPGQLQSSWADEPSISRYIIDYPAGAWQVPGRLLLQDLSLGVGRDGRVVWRSEEPAQRWSTDGTAAGTRAEPIPEAQRWGLVCRVGAMRAVVQQERWVVSGAGEGTPPSASVSGILEGCGALDARRMWWIERGDEGSTLKSWAPGRSEPAALFTVAPGFKIEALGVDGGLLWLRAVSARPDMVGLTPAKLWVTDGSAAGTRRLETAGPVMVAPQPVLTQAGLVFSMDHPEYGRELFVWPTEAR